MKNPLPCVLLSSLALVACGKSGPSAPTGGTPPAKTAAHDDDDHGETKPVGDLTIGAHTFTVSRGANVEAGKETFVFAAFAAGKPVPATMRSWIGIESGQGSMKAKMSKEDEHTMHAHVQVPKPMPDDSRIWIEIEEGTDVKRGSIAWKP